MHPKDICRKMMTEVDDTVLFTGRDLSSRLCCGRQLWQNGLPCRRAQIYKERSRQKILHENNVQSSILRYEDKLNVSSYMNEFLNGNLLNLIKIRSFDPLP